MRNKSRLYLHFPDEKDNRLIDIEVCFTKYYHRGNKQRLGLSSISRDLLDYLIERITVTYKVHSKERDRQDFNNYCKKLSNVSYPDSSIKKAFSELAKRQLLLKGDIKGTYYINPLYYSREDESHRKQTILDLTLEGILKQF